MKKFLIATILVIMATSCFSQLSYFSISGDDSDYSFIMVDNPYVVSNSLCIIIWNDGKYLLENNKTVRLDSVVYELRNYNGSYSISDMKSILSAFFNNIINEHNFKIIINEFVVFEVFIEGSIYTVIDKTKNKKAIFWDFKGAKDYMFEALINEIKNANNG